MASSKMYTVMKTVTPRWAASVLKTKNPANRKCDDRWVDRLSKFITDGKFVTTHQGIAFNCDGSLRDGQHRLMAIVKSGTPVKMLVTYGVPNDAMDWIDTHKLRSDRDNLWMHGDQRSAAFVAVAKAMRQDYIGTSKEDRDWFREFSRRHAEAIEFAVSLGGGKCIRHARVRAVIARAWYTCDRERLKVFGKVLATGMPDNPKTDSAAVLLRTFILTNPIAGRVNLVDLYEKTQSAVQNFMKGSALSKLRGVKGLAFIIPGDHIEE